MCGGEGGCIVIMQSSRLQPSDLWSSYTIFHLPIYRQDIQLRLLAGMACTDVSDNTHESTMEYMIHVKRMDAWSSFRASDYIIQLCIYMNLRKFIA